MSGALLFGIKLAEYLENRELIIACTLPTEMVMEPDIGITLPKSSHARSAQKRPHTHSLWQLTPAPYNSRQSLNKR